MPFGLLGTLLLLLPGGVWALGSRVRQSPGWLWVTPGGAAELGCPLETSATSAEWYWEKADGSLAWIYRSSQNSPPQRGKYSGKNETGGGFSLTIAPAQREDSGVYYCSPPSFHPSFGNGTRLIVTNATQPQLSILLPIEEEEEGERGEEDPPGKKPPLLCHLWDLPPGWDTVLWQLGDTGGPVVATEGPVVATPEQGGGLSGWSITWGGAASCTALGGDGGNVTVTVGPREAGGCPSWPLALGFSFISILSLLQVTILLCRHRLPTEGSSPGRR